MAGFDQLQKRPAGRFINTESGNRISRHLKGIQHPIHRQLTEHNQLRNPRQHMPMRAVHQPGEVIGHDLGRGQGFAGVGQQFFAVDAGGDKVAAVRGLADQDSRTRRTEVPHAKPP